MGSTIPLPPDPTAFELPLLPHDYNTLLVAVMPGAVDTEFSKNSAMPKTNPADIAATALQAVIDEVEDVYPGEEAQNTIAQISSDRKALEKQFAQQLPTSGK